MFLFLLYEYVSYMRICAGGYHRLMSSACTLRTPQVHKGISASGMACCTAVVSLPGIPGSCIYYYGIKSVAGT